MDNIMDPELATEMVKLLGQELKVVRAQLRETERRTSTPSMSGHNGQQLVLENNALKAENTALQERIARLQHTLALSSHVKSEEELPRPIQYAEPTSHTGEEPARPLAENEDLNHEREKALQTQAELSSLQEKYQRSKSRVREYKETLRELRGELSNNSEELQQLRRTVVSEIDCRIFLEDLPYQPIEGQLDLASIQLHTRGGRRAKFPKDVLDACTGDTPYIVNCHEVVWSSSGIALGLVIKPAFQYNPKTQGGRWTELQDRFDAGKQMDLCYSSGNTICYLGTYERAADQATMVVALNTLQHLDSTILEHASKCTTLFPELVPPIQTQMINNMYMQGVIKLQCFVIRCVAINHAFAEKLRDTYAPLPPSAIPRSELTNKSNPKRKRKRSPKPTTPSTRTKKRKH